MAWGIVTAGLGSLGGGSKIAVVGNVETRVRRLYFSPGVARIECYPTEIEEVTRKTKQGVLGWIEEKAGERELDFDLQVSCRLPGKLPSLVKVDYSLAGAAVAVAILEGLFRREGITTSPRSDLAFSGSVEALSVQEVAGVGATRSDQQEAAQGQQKTLLAPFLTGDQRLSTLNELFGRAFEGSAPIAAVKRTLEMAVLLGRAEGVGLYSYYREAQRLAGQDKARAAQYIRDNMNFLQGSPLLHLALQGLRLCLERETGSASIRDSDKALAGFAGALKSGGYRALQVDQMARHAFLLREEKREQDAETVMRHLETESQTLFQEIENRDRTPIAMVPHMQGRLAYYRGDFQESLEHYAIACELIGSPIDSSFEETLSDLHNSAGKDFNDICDFPMALDLFARALRVRSKWNLEEKVARTKGSAAESLLRLGVLQVAESLYLQDLKNLQRIGQHRDVPRVQNYLGNTWLAQRKYGEAEGLFRATLDQYTAAGDSRNLSYSLLGLSLALLGQGKGANEIESLIAGHEAGFPDRGTEVLPVANLCLVRGMLRRGAGELEAALSDLCRAATLLDQEQYTVEAAVVLLEAAITLIWPGAGKASSSLEAKARETLQDLQTSHSGLTLSLGDLPADLREAAFGLLQLFEGTHTESRRHFPKVAASLESGNPAYASLWPEVNAQLGGNPGLCSPQAFFGEMRGHIKRARERWAVPQEALKAIRRAQAMVFPYNVVFRVIP